MTASSPIQFEARKRILFVDDEIGVLDGLGLALRRRRHVWDMRFVCGGQAALDAIEAQPFDVVVSDMRMPGIDGERLLREVQRIRPAAVRIVLSGPTDQEASRRLIHVAHQFLAKPCDRDSLCHTLERACDLHRVLQSDALRAMVGGLGQLPPAPSVYLELSRLIDSQSATLGDIARVVERDPALSAKVLQVVNSAFFAVRRQVTSIERAVSLLGAESTRAVVLSVEAYRAGTPPACSRKLLDDLYEHVAVTARIARSIADPAVRDLAFIGGVLHGIGVLVFATKVPEAYAECAAAARTAEGGLEAAEIAQFGVTHAALGGYLLGLWGIVPALVDGIVHYPEPTPCADPGSDLATILHVACCLAHESRHASAESRPLSAAVVETLGSKIEVWRALAHAELLSRDG